MKTDTQHTLDYYLGLEYPFIVHADLDDGGYVIEFPDLPGCMTQVDKIDEIGPMADEIRRLWLKTAYEDGYEIALPSSPETYSGRFNLRIPRSLHRALAETADREGVSLNQHVATLLSQRNPLGEVNGRIERIEREMRTLNIRLRYHAVELPNRMGNRRLEVIPGGKAEALAI